MTSACPTSSLAAVSTGPRDGTTSRGLSVAPCTNAWSSSGGSYPCAVAAQSGLRWKAGAAFGTCCGSRLDKESWLWDHADQREACAFRGVIAGAEQLRVGRVDQFHTEADQRAVSAVHIEAQLFRRVIQVLHGADSLASHVGSGTVRVSFDQVEDNAPSGLT